MLNLPGHHTTASIVAEVEDTAYWGLKCRNKTELNGYNAQPGITCVIADCEGKITLEFYIGTETRLENSLHKADMLIDTLTDLRKGLVKEHERLVKRKRRIPPGKVHGAFDD